MELPFGFVGRILFGVIIIVVVLALIYYLWTGAYIPLVSELVAVLEPFYIF